MAKFDIVPEWEDYLKRLQTLEFNIQNDTGKAGIIDETVQKYANNPAFYTSFAYQNQLLKELKEYLAELTAQTRNAGKLMSKRAMQKFLDSSERAQRTDKALAALDQLSDRQAARRLDIYFADLEKNFGVMRADIEIYKRNATVSGVTAKQSIKDIVQRTKAGETLAFGFNRSAKRVAIDSARREAQESAFEEYRKVAKAKEKWVWVAISGKPCPDCTARAGVVLPLPMWKKKGVPGSGKTICRASCKCQLIPVSVAEDQLEDIREFKWDKEKTVLTTFRDARTFAAKSNSLEENVKKK